MAALFDSIPTDWLPVTGPLKVHTWPSLSIGAKWYVILDTGGDGFEIME